MLRDSPSLAGTIAAVIADEIEAAREIAAIGLSGEAPGIDLATVGFFSGSGTRDMAALIDPATPGALLLMNNAANANSGTVQLKALFPNLRHRLWPGTFVNVELTTAVAQPAATVPTNAIQLGANGNFAFVVGSDNKVTLRPVTVGQRYRGEALVTQGLKPHEVVVTQGQYRLTAGTQVVASTPQDVADSSTATAGMLP